MITAFASIFSLLLGYSRIPFAAARDGNFFPALGKLHPTQNFPCVSLLWLGGTAAFFCFFSLGEVIAGLVVLRIPRAIPRAARWRSVPAAHAARPAHARSAFWLYPLPPLGALAGFTWILIGRKNFTHELRPAVAIIVVGAAAYAVWNRRATASAS